MVHELEVPLAHASLEINRHEAFGVEIVAGPVSAVIVRGRRLDRQIHKAELWIGADVGPHPDIAVDGPGIVLPGLVAGLSRPRNRIEPPDLLAGADVERANEAFGVVVSSDGRT